MLYIPYRGLSDRRGRHVDTMSTPSRPRCHCIARPDQDIVVANPQRDVSQPDVGDRGDLPGYRSSPGSPGRPPNTPVALAERINRDVAEILRRPDVRGKLREMQMEPVGSTRAEAAQFFAEEAALWGKVIDDAKITIQ
jgi:hypothetical protein